MSFHVPSPLQVFGPDSVEGDTGKVFNQHPMTEDTVEQSIINIIETQAVRPGWPDLTPLKYVYWGVSITFLS